VEQFLCLLVNGLDAKFKASIAKRYEAERGSGDTEDRKPGDLEDGVEGEKSRELVRGDVEGERPDG
jgi:hypothetical protein